MRDKAERPDLDGRWTAGNLTALHIAMTQSEDLRDAVEAALPGFDTLDLAAMRGALGSAYQLW